MHDGASRPRTTSLNRTSCCASIRQAGGQSRVSDDDYLEGAPELIGEIAASSVTYDLHDKLRVYRRNGVREYVVWRVHDRQIDWFVLADDEYRRLEPDAAGVLHSTVFPGLRLAQSSALLAGDLATVLTELQRGLGTDEHSAHSSSGWGPRRRPPGAPSLPQAARCSRPESRLTTSRPSYRQGVHGRFNGWPTVPGRAMSGTLRSDDCRPVLLSSPPPSPY